MTPQHIHTVFVHTGLSSFPVKLNQFHRYGFNSPTLMVSKEGLKADKSSGLPNPKA